MLIHLLCLAIGDEVGDAGAHAGKETDKQTDDKGDDDDFGVIDKVLHGEAKAAKGSSVNRGHFLLAFCIAGGNLLQCKGTHQHGDHVDAAVEIGVAKGEAQLVGDLVRADHGKEEADEGSQKALKHGAVAEADDHRDGHEAEGEVFPGSQRECDVGDGAGAEHGNDDGNEGSDEGTSDADGQSLCSPAAFGHRIAVIAGADGGSRTRNADQNGGNEGTGNTADIHADKHGKAQVGVKREGHGEYQGDSKTTRKTRDGA